MGAEEEKKYIKPGDSVSSGEKVVKFGGLMPQEEISLRVLQNLNRKRGGGERNTDTEQRNAEILKKDTEGLRTQREIDEAKGESRE